MKKYIFILTLFIGIGCAKASSPKMLIYRNDEKFNIIEMTNGTSLSHITNLSSPMLNIQTSNNDSENFIPFSAIDSCVIRLIDIPTLHFRLHDYPEATTLWDKELYLDSSLDINGNGYSEDAYNLSLTIKGRGNSTWSMKKKPIRLKFTKKTSICGFKKAKSYVLLANYIDRTLCKNAISFWIANRIGLPYSNHFTPCNVILNETHQGSYLLTEKIGINSTSVNIDEATGVLLELSTEYDEPYKFRSAIYNLPVMIKDPDFDEMYVNDSTSLLPQQRLNEWEKDFNIAEQLVVSGKGFEAFDLNSFVKYVFLYNLAGNNEIGYPKSLYIYKEKIGTNTSYHFGPAWDFDVAFDHMMPDDSTQGYTTVEPTSSLWCNVLMRKLINTQGFMTAYKNLFDDFEQNIYPDLLKFIDEYSALIEPSAKIDGQIWSDKGDVFSWCYRDSSFDTHSYITSLCTWIKIRIEHMRRSINEGRI